MRTNLVLIVIACLFVLELLAPTTYAQGVRRKTEVAIHGEMFHINGKPTYQGRMWNGKKIEGLLLNSRMVQATFDDLNPETVKLWAYPDTKKWDADRNTREFLEAMPMWRKHGLLGITLNLQGGSPQGYSQKQPWHNSAFKEDGSLRPEYMKRFEQVLDKADELGMVVLLGLFYFGQDERLKDEDAIKRGVDNAVDWLFDKGYRNVLIEVNNECNVRYDHEILKPQRVHELIERVKKRTRDGRRFLVGTSYGGGVIPKENVVRASDYLLLHGNGVKEPARIAEMVRQTRKVPGYRDMPILFNEDDHFDFDQPKNNFVAAVGEYASWGFFDFRMKGEGFDEGYQSVPVNWSAMSQRKQGFFKLLSELTGAPGSAPRKGVQRTFPGKTWSTQTPQQAGLDVKKLDAFREAVGGRGAVVAAGISFTPGATSPNARISPLHSSHGLFICCSCFSSRERSRVSTIRSPYSSRGSTISMRDSGSRTAKSPGVSSRVKPPAMASRKAPVRRTTTVITTWRFSSTRSCSRHTKAAMKKWTPTCCKPGSQAPSSAKTIRRSWRSVPGIDQDVWACRCAMRAASDCSISI